MTRTLSTSFVCLALGAAMLSGCGDTRRSLGLDRTAPDEFTVVTRAPLSMPPEYRLRPPRPGAARPQDVEATQQAAQAVLGVPSTSVRSYAGTGPGSAAEQALVARAGQIQPGIRELIDQESTALVVADKRWIDSLMFWQKPNPPGVVVNAQAEAERLRQNAAEGKPLNEGDVPVIERRRKAPLEGLFN